jgi:hypothetical protein
MLTEYKSSSTRLLLYNADNFCYFIQINKRSLRKNFVRFWQHPGPGDEK